MKALDISAILKEMCLPVQPGPLGFLIHSGVYKDYRIERGSGIAVRGDVWSLKEVRSGERIGNPCRTKAELRLVLREWAAFLEWGQKPGPEYFARRHQTRLNDGYIRRALQMGIAATEEGRQEPIRYSIHAVVRGLPCAVKRKSDHGQPTLVTWGLLLTPKELERP